MALVLALATGLWAEDRAPLEMVLFHNPTCPACQKVVALGPEMQKLDPKIKIVLHKNVTAEDQEAAKLLGLVLRDAVTLRKVFVGVDEALGKGVLAHVAGQLAAESEAGAQFAAQKAV